MIGLGTVMNVAAGSGLKILSHVLSEAISGYFRNKELTLRALNEKADNIVKLQSGDDLADDFTRHTRRILAFMLCFTACTIMALFAIQSSETVPFLIDRDHGIFGWLLGGTNQTIVQVSKAQMIMNMWTLLEIMFGFYFTKIGKK